MGLPRRAYRVPATGQIYRDVSPYIIPHGASGVLQGGGKYSVQLVRSERFTGIYGTRQFDITVQDTKRSTPLEKLAGVHSGIGCVEKAASLSLTAHSTIADDRGIP